MNSGAVLLVLVSLLSLLWSAQSRPWGQPSNNFFNAVQSLRQFVGRFEFDSRPIWTLHGGPQSRDHPDSLGSWECTTCKVLVSLLQDLFAKNATEEEVVKAITAVCIDFKIEDENVCRGITIEFKDEVLTVFDQIALGPDELCGFVIGSDCGNPYDPYNQTWTVTFPSTPKPPVVPVPAPQPGSPTTKILFISDLHFDKNYTQGLSAECGEPLCCRPPNGPATGGKRAAGYWGDYNCDANIHLLVNLFTHLRNISSQFDWVYMTGDLPAHNVWNQTREDQLYILKVITDLFKTYLPGKVVYPALGNHESSPVDSFPPLTITGPNSNQWLRDALAEYWSTWLPSETMATIKKGGYYTTLVRKGLRVVSLNMNYCNTNNWWLLINSTDPAQELEWLVGVLQTAENKGEKVHIIGHIHPGGSCLKTWSWQYYDIVNRYESTIINQFFGHAHTDFFEMFYDLKDKSRPTSVAFVGPSVTTYTDLNPGFRIYTLDGNYDNSTQAILDHETYYFNLTQANLNNEAVWQFEYSAKSAFGMEALRPTDWNKLVEVFEKDNDLFNKFYDYYYKMHTPGPCDTSCKAGHICGLKSGRSQDRTFCATPPGVRYEDLRAYLDRVQQC